MSREAEGEHDLFRQGSAGEGPQVIEDPVAERLGITLGSVPVKFREQLGLTFGPTKNT